MELGERIATLREEKALTQAELAEKAGISPSTLSLIESGKVPRPHVGTIRKIARALGIEPGDLRRVEGLAAPKEERRSPSELTLNHVLAEEGRRAELEEIRNLYQPSRDGLDRYCARWEKRLADDDLTHEALEEFLRAGVDWEPILTEALMGEALELSKVLRTNEPAEIWSESVLMPALNRYHALYRRLVDISDEKDGKTPATKHDVVDEVAQKRLERERTKRAS